jgi:hypothetical protein
MRQHTGKLSFASLRTVGIRVVPSPESTALSSPRARRSAPWAECSGRQVLGAVLPRGSGEERLLCWVPPVGQS